MCSSYKLRTFIDTKLTIIKGCVICIHFVWVNWGRISHNSYIQKRFLCLVYIKVYLLSLLYRSLIERPKLHVAIKPLYSYTYIPLHCTYN